MPPPLGRLPQGRSSLSFDTASQTLPAWNIERQGRVGRYAMTVRLSIGGEGGFGQSLRGLSHAEDVSLETWQV